MKPLQYLSIALVAQLGLTALTWWPDNAQHVTPQPLLAQHGDALTRLEIFDGPQDKEPLVLTLSSSKQWLVNTAHDYPADKTKVDRVISALSAIEIASPITTSASSHKALKVGDDNFTKRIVLTSPKGTRTYVMSAAKRNTVYMREAGQDQVYEISGLNLFSLHDKARGYLPDNYISFDTENITGLTITKRDKKLTLVKVGEQWQVEGAPERVVNTTALDTFLEKAHEIRLDDVIGTSVTPEMDLGQNAPFHLAWTVSQNEESSTDGYTLGAKQGDAYLVYAPNQPFVVTTPTYAVKDILALDLSDLTLDAPPSPPAP